MGERGQILIEDCGVYLYTHWEGDNLRKILATALAKKWRWSDPEYLARIIFDVMVGKYQGEETSYGIGTKLHGDLNYPLLKVNCKKETVYSLGDDDEEWSFEQFIRNETSGSMSKQ